MDRREFHMHARNGTLFAGDKLNLGLTDLPVMRIPCF